MLPRLSQMSPYSFLTPVKKDKSHSISIDLNRTKRKTHKKDLSQNDKYYSARVSMLKTDTSVRVDSKSKLSFNQNQFIEDQKILLNLVSSSINNQPRRSILITEFPKDQRTNYGRARITSTGKDPNFKKFTPPFLMKPNQKLELIGTSAFSSVYKIELTDIQKVFALKVKKMTSEEREREYMILRQFFGQAGHPNVIRLQHSFTTESLSVKGEKYINLVTDYMPMNLKQYIQAYKIRNKIIPKILVKLLSYQLCRALAYLHELKIIHRDLNPENILVDNETFRLKICDFGKAKFMQRGEISLTEIGNRSYRAPELLLGAKSYDMSADLWALGCLIMELMVQKPIFNGSSNEEVFCEIIKQLGTPLPNDLTQMGSNISDLKLPNIRSQIWQSKIKNHLPDDGIIDIVQQLLQYQPQKRGKAFELLTHPYFKELYKSNVKINTIDIPDIFDFTYDEMKIPKYKQHSTQLIPDWYQSKQKMITKPEDVNDILKTQFT